MENKFSLDFFNLEGKVAIVTGGNTGIGMAYAEALAKAGADLLLQYGKETGANVYIYRFPNVFGKWCKPN